MENQLIALSTDTKRIFGRVPRKWRLHRRRHSYGREGLH